MVGGRIRAGALAPASPAAGIAVGGGAGRLRLGLGSGHGTSWPLRPRLPHGRRQASGVLEKRGRYRGHLRRKRRGDTGRGSRGETAQLRPNPPGSPHSLAHIGACGADPALTSPRCGTAAPPERRSRLLACTHLR
ncbi:hypothetical protein DGo_PA0004 (plasmid) [Deinococcus gobiensis I-0]|uniref:Uncharacterized protein n=1 Tax=Deinococcus gobiensis (strain DSM 21396 / JCM 16679 / CGMCC 1.7299 / I-0) TaxID=745776 RepID=H8H0M1_DEIGI|nr:hypothetical protein DGo_PA0004 [Deinococcus gobiensis I-0]